ncbi:hypothetical protein BDR07DRAFT_1381437 [Suillus spraguei]|nr:hypothetical protein BDR07DRAFT_1381437 [Suillus spraguei]
MTDQLFKVVLGHLHDLTDIQKWQWESKGIKAILPPIMGVVKNNSVIRPQFRVLWRAVREEFIMKLLSGYCASLQSAESAEDAAKEVGHGWVNVEDYAYVDAGEYKTLKEELVSDKVGLAIQMAANQEVENSKTLAASHTVNSPISYVEGTGELDTMGGVRASWV